MPRPSPVAAALKRQAKEMQQQRVLDLDAEGMSLNAISKKEKLSKVWHKSNLQATVQTIIKNFRYRPNTSAIRKGGNKPKMTERYMRHLRRLSWQHPFWSVTRLVESLHQSTMEALSNRPPGAVVRVCVEFFSFRYLISLLVVWQPMQ